LKTIDLDPSLRTDPRFGRQRFSAKAAYIEMYMYAASTENWGMFSVTIEDIAWILGRGNEIELMQKDIDALVGTGLLIAHPDGSIEIAGFKETQKRIVDNRDYYKKLQAARRAKSEQQPEPEPEPKPETITQGDDTEDTSLCNPDVTCNTNVSNTDVNSITKPNLTKPNLTKLNKEGFAQSANPPTPSKSKSLSEPKQPKPQKSEAEQRRGVFFVKIADVCKIPSDSKPHVRAINAAAVWFASKPIEPRRLDDFSAWWFANDWRGLKGEYPKPDQIVSEWPKFELGVTAKKTTQPFAARQTKGEMQMSNIQAGINAFLAGGDN